MSAMNGADACSRAVALAKELIARLERLGSNGSREALLIYRKQSGCATEDTEIQIYLSGSAQGNPELPAIILTVGISAVSH